MKTTYKVVHCAEQKTNMISRFHIYAISFRGIYERWICIYVSHMRSLTSTLWPEALDIYFSRYISHYLHISLNKYGYNIVNTAHYPHSIWAYRSDSGAVYAKTQLTVTYTSYIQEDTYTSYQKIRKRFLKCRQAITWQATWLDQVYGKCYSYQYLYLLQKASMVMCWVVDVFPCRWYGRW